MGAVLIVYHIGGGDDEIGPITQVCNQFDYKLITFEALDGTCVADRVGDSVPFYINKFPLSSGILPPNQKYAGEVHHEISWGDNTELDRKIVLKTTTIDELAKTNPQPDVLSIDCQGAELRILWGAAETLKQTLCVIAEVEFVPIYLGQHLFHEQMGFLLPYRFRLMELFSMQYWHPHERFGNGSLSVAEACWLRDDYENLTGAQLETLAKIAAGFGRLSLALKLIPMIPGGCDNPTLRSLWEHRDNPDIRKAARG